MHYLISVSLTSTSRRDNAAEHAVVFSTQFLKVDIAEVYGYREGRDQMSRMKSSVSSLDVIAGTHISVNRLRRAGDNSRFPKSPPGFMVAITWKPDAAYISALA